MKNNTFKRVLAGSLALLTVAAYVPANVGGILPDVANFAIVASAADLPGADAENPVLAKGEDYTVGNKTVKVESSTFDAVTKITVDADMTKLTFNDDDKKFVNIPLGQQVKVTENGDAVTLAFEPINAQAGGILRVAEDSAFVDGVYEVTTDAGKYEYTKVSGTTVWDLQEGKRYVIRTTAYFEGVGDNAALLDAARYDSGKDLNGDDLTAGQYEYDIKKVVKNGTLNLATIKATLTKNQGVDGKGFPETPVIKQNNTEIIIKNEGYQVAQGAPVEITATPGETHTNMMLAITGNGATKSQTKNNGALTLTFVPMAAEIVVSWDEYKPTLQLTNDNGTIKATDVGFNALLTNAVVGTYEFKYGKGEGTFTAAGVNSKGEYISDGVDTKASVDVTASKVTVGKLFHMDTSISVIITFAVNTFQGIALELNCLYFLQSATPQMDAALH